MHATKAVLLSVSLFLCQSLTAANCEDGTVLVSGESAYPPLSWRHKDGKLRGASIDLVSEIFAEKNIKVITDSGGPWKRIVLNAQRGKVDMVVGIRRTPEREKYLHFIEPAITPAAQAIFIRKQNEFQYKQWSDLKGKVGGVTLGASFDDTFDTYAKNNLHLEQVKTVEQNFKKLANHRIDYFLGPLLPTLLYAEKSGDRYKIQFVRPPFMIINEYVAFSKRSNCQQYAAYFEQRIAQKIAEGEMDDLLEKQYLLW